jgi:hypothetical protein
MIGLSGRIRIIPWPTFRLWYHAGEAGRPEIQLVHEDLNEADRVVRAHIIVHRLGQEQKLRAVMSRKMCHDREYHGEPLTRQKNQPGCMIGAQLGRIRGYFCMGSGR